MRLKESKGKKRDLLVHLSDLVEGGEEKERTWRRGVHH
jgi:hypothetical protein